MYSSIIKDTSCCTPSYVLISDDGKFICSVFTFFPPKSCSIFLVNFTFYIPRIFWRPLGVVCHAPGWKRRIHRFSPEMQNACVLVGHFAGRPQQHTSRGIKRGIYLFPYPAFCQAEIRVLMEIYDKYCLTRNKQYMFFMYSSAKRQASFKTCMQVCVRVYRALCAAFTVNTVSISAHPIGYPFRCHRLPAPKQGVQQCVSS